MDELKPCPFCASDPTEGFDGLVGCPSGDCPMGELRGMTHDKWNLRPSCPDCAEKEDYEEKVRIGIQIAKSYICGGRRDDAIAILETLVGPPAAQPEKGELCCGGYRNCPNDSPAAKPEKCPKPHVCENENEHPCPMCDCCPPAPVDGKAGEEAK